MKAGMARLGQLQQREQDLEDEIEEEETFSLDQPH